MSKGPIPLTPAIVASLDSLTTRESFLDALVVSLNVGLAILISQVHVDRTQGVLKPQIRNKSPVEDEILNELANRYRIAGWKVSWEMKPRGSILEPYVYTFILKP